MPRAYCNDCFLTRGGATAREPRRQVRPQDVRFQIHQRHDQQRDCQDPGHDQGRPPEYDQDFHHQVPEPP